MAIVTSFHGFFPLGLAITPDNRIAENLAGSE